MEEAIHPDWSIETENLRETVSFADQAYRQLLDHEEGLLCRNHCGRERRSRRRPALYARRIAGKPPEMVWQRPARPLFYPGGFYPDGGSGGPKRYYIGKFGITDYKTGRIIVVDWRAPAADLYYSGNTGRTGYDAPGGYYSGELTLKRRFSIEDGQLLALYDSDVVAQEKFLESILNNQTSSRLKDIVSTIQVEQNAVIRNDYYDNVIVQGVAGSGKTTIALHRVAYLLYKYQDMLRPEQIIIFAPNLLFLNYIRDVLPDLGVENIRQTTYQNWCAELLDRFNVSLRPVRGCAPLARETQLKDYVSGFLHDLARQLYPFEDVSFSGRTAIGAGQIKAELYTNLERDGLALRLEAVRTVIRQAVDRTRDDLIESANQKTLQKIREIRFLPLSEEEMKRRISSLNKEFDGYAAGQKKSAAAAARTCTRYAAARPDKIVRRFFDFLRRSDVITARESRRAAAMLTAGQFDLNYIDILFDILIYCAGRRQFGDKSVRHIIIDEAQDYSPRDISLILRACPGTTFTFAGDIMQGIANPYGVTRWEDVLNLPGLSARLCYLTVGYRSTHEICNLARRVAVRHVKAEHSFSNQFVRNGSAPILRRMKKKQTPDFVREMVSHFTSLDLNSIAVITQNRAESEAALAWLDGNAVLLSDEYDGALSGVLITDVVSSKGLEFDAVIVPDASGYDVEGSFADARRYYVAVTRALHHLAVGFSGE